jgi:hypothetical protein
MRQTLRPAATPPRRPPVNQRQKLSQQPRPLDDPWSLEMTRLLRQAAEVREERDHARTSEDAASARNENEALHALIRTGGRSKAGVEPSRLAPAARREPRR